MLLIVATQIVGSFEMKWVEIMSLPELHSWMGDWFLLVLFILSGEVESNSLGLWTHLVKWLFFFVRDPPKKVVFLLQGEPTKRHPDDPVAGLKAVTKDSKTKVLLKGCLSRKSLRLQIMIHPFGFRFHLPFLPKSIG